MIIYKHKLEEFAEDPGVSFVGVKDEFVPDQDMDLAEILERFTRGEQLNIGADGNFSEGFEDEDNPLNADLEKLAHMDMTERDEYMAALKDLHHKFEKQERDREKAETDRAKELADKKRERSIRMKIERERARIAEQKPN